MAQPAGRDAYYLGLLHIKMAIEDVLRQAGAKVGSRCISHPRLPRPGIAPPDRLKIAAVPDDAPRITVDFTRGEIAGSAQGVDREEVREKVRRYAAAYESFRSSPDRSVRPFVISQAPVKPGALTHKAVPWRPRSV